MKKTIKIRFGNPYHIPSALDGIEILYPYEIITIIDQKYAIPEEEKNVKEIRVMISGSLAITWGFQIWQPSVYYRDLIKLLFVYALNEIKEMYFERKLEDQIVKTITSSNHPSKRLYDVNKIPEVLGFEEILETIDTAEVEVGKKSSANNKIESPIVFISYSWDSDSHKEWIRNIADKLICKGVDVILDQYEIKLGRSLNHFVEQSISRSNKTLIFFTPNYRLKADNRKGGVGYEYSIINNELYQDQINNEKFIPILREGKQIESIPSFMQQYVYLDLRDESNFDFQFEELLREIYNKPRHKKPEIGKMPDFV